MKKRSLPTVADTLGVGALLALLLVLAAAIFLPFG